MHIKRKKLFLKVYCGLRDGINPHQGKLGLFFSLDCTKASWCGGGVNLVKISLESSFPCHSSEEIRFMSLYNDFTESGLGHYMCSLIGLYK